MGVMRRITTEGSALSRRTVEDGFLLVEVMVSAVVLLVLAMATLQIIDRAGSRPATTARAASRPRWPRPTRTASVR